MISPQIGSYISDGEWGERWVSHTADEHVQYVLQAMAEIHGEVVNEQYTGNYDRRCWTLDPLASGSWASPLIGQHELYLPEYFKTHNNVRCIISFPDITMDNPSHADNFPRAR